MNKEKLLEYIENLKQQQATGLELFNKASGALQLADKLLADIGEPDALTLEQFGEAMGGTVEAIEPISDVKN